MTTPYEEILLSRGRPISVCGCDDCVCRLHTFPRDDRCVWCRNDVHGAPRRRARSTVQTEIGDVDDPAEFYREGRDPQRCAVPDCERWATWELWLWPPNRTIVQLVCDGCLSAGIEIPYTVKRPNEAHEPDYQDRTLEVASP